MRRRSHHLAVAALIACCLVGAVARAPPPMRPPDRVVPQRVQRVRAVVNVNAASEAELVTLPGVGRVTARAIIEARPYATVDDLLRARGIGPARLRRMLPFVTVR